MDVPFLDETLPPAFDLGFGQFVDVKLLLDVEVEAEHRLVGVEVVFGQRPLIVWQRLGFALCVVIVRPMTTMSVFAVW